jgi:hypothetical protein
MTEMIITIGSAEKEQLILLHFMAWTTPLTSWSYFTNIYSTLKVFEIQQEDS